MIKSDFGKVEVKGNKILIMTEVSALLHSLRKTKTLTKEELIKIIKDSFRSEEEIEKNANKILNNMTLSESLELIKDVIEAKKSGESNFEDDEIALKKVEIDTNGKSQEQIKQELKNALDEIFKK